MKKLFLSFIICCCLALASSERKPKICKSTTVRSVFDLQQLQNCTIVTGHVRLVLMQFTADSLASLKPLAIEEITEYLLVYRVNGLDSLERIFPNLLVIRGVQLLYDQYGLVLHENRDLENIGLLSLLRILRGSVRIEDNPLLCYTHTVNWISILGKTNKKYYYVLKNNKSPNYCPLCYSLKPKEDERHQHCWSLGRLQKKPLDQYNYTCATDCPSKICDKKGKCCSGNCLSSCSDYNCRYCVNLLANNTCVNKCLAPKFAAFKRQCESNCHKFGLKQLNGDCVEKCPKLYREVESHGEITCTFNCTGNFTIKNSNDLEGFADCSILEGSLTFELSDLNKTNIEDLEKAFLNIREIRGYLKILRSPQLVSLYFLRNLHTIAGTYLIDNSFALYIVDNHYLEELWNAKQKVSIPKGRIYFHLNPRLCVNKIMDLQPQLKESDITIMDVSPNSNGEGVICGDVVRELNVSIDEYNAHEARIHIEFLNSEELHLLLGYIFLYKEAPDRNITKFDGRHGCGNDKWFMKTTNNKLRRYVLSDLKPNTQYAYAIQTLTMNDYHYTMDAISPIQYFRTAPAKPGPLEKIYYHTLSASKIEIHWWPPLYPNGNIKKYVLHYLENNSNHTETEEKGKVDVCHCPKFDNEISGPMPLDEDFYDRELMVYDEALDNFIYVADKEKNGTKPKTVEENQAYQKQAYEQQLQIYEIAFNSSMKEQDLRKEDFDISPIKSVCKKSKPELSFQLENNCDELEVIKGDYEFSGDTHSFTLTGLKPENTYRVSLRACVDDLQNGCGTETIIWAETMSKRLETFLDTLNLTRNN